MKLKKKLKKWAKNKEILTWDRAGIGYSLSIMILLVTFLTWFSISHWCWWRIWDILLIITLIIWGIHSIKAYTSSTKMIYIDEHNRRRRKSVSERTTKTFSNGCSGCALAFPVIGTIIAELYILFGKSDSLNLWIIIPCVFIGLVLKLAHDNW